MYTTWLNPSTGHRVYICGRC